jgi:DNA-binding PadR family transcriptional regulator
MCCPDHPSDHSGQTHRPQWTSRCRHGTVGGVPELNATSAALLGLLHDRPMTGGELVSAAAQRFGGFFGVTRSQVYRELPTLVEKGLLKPGKQGARSSQQYAITAAGRKAFRTWLASAAEPDPVRSPLILRLVLAASLSEKQRADLLGQARQAYTAQLEKARAAVKAADDPYARAAADFVVGHTRAVLKLLDAIPAA